MKQHLRVCAVTLVLISLSAYSQSADTSTKPISRLTEQAAVEEAEKIMAEVSQMRLTFGDDSYTVRSMDDEQPGRIVLTGKERRRTVVVTLFIDSQGGINTDQAIVMAYKGRGKRHGEKFELQGELHHDQPQEESDLTEVEGTFKSASGSEKNLDLLFTPGLLALGKGEFDIDHSGKVGFFTGGLGADTYLKMREFLKENPNLKVLELYTVPGSSADRFNAYAALRLREAGVATRITKTSVIASGGVDLYAAGVRRYAEQGAKVGVHSWGGGGKSAHEIPMDDPQHQFQINYFTLMMGDQGKPFYEFTINSAPADDMHWMSWDEMIEYGLVTNEI